MTLLVLASLLASELGDKCFPDRNLRAGTPARGFGRPSARPGIGIKFCHSPNAGGLKVLEISGSVD